MWSFLLIIIPALFAGSLLLKNSDNEIYRAGTLGLDREGSVFFTQRPLGRTQRSQRIFDFLIKKENPQNIFMQASPNL